MDDSGSGAAVLDSLRGKFDNAMAETTNLRKFRALLDVVSETQSLRSKVTRNLKEHQKNESYLELEKRFLTKHETKLDVLAQGLFHCYDSPGKARETLDRLCTDYDTQYALEVVRLGIRRLAKPLGFDILGIKSDTRKVAETFFETTLLPTLEKVIPDHGDYMKLKRLNVEERYDTVLHEIEMGRQAVTAVEAGLKKYKGEAETVAKMLADEEVAELNSEEAAERLMLLPAKMREAIYAAEREALQKPRGAL